MLARVVLPIYKAIRSSSLNNRNSIHPSTGSASVGRPFCHKLKRSLKVAA
jgi:hypothetical protein